MRTDVITTKRVFHFRDLSEAEGLILRAMVNINDEGLLKSLRGDELSWNHEVNEAEALKIAITLRDKIFEAVDYES